MKYEQYFQEYLATQLIQLASGKYQLKDCPSICFISMSGNPVKDFKQTYITKYNELLDKWFDTIHPY